MKLPSYPTPPACSSPNIPSDFDAKAGLSVIDPTKGRFSYAHSGVVLPRKLGQGMSLRDDLKFHSYGWNLGVRPEPHASIPPTVRRCLTFYDVSVYSQRYFEVVDPVYHFVDRTLFHDRCAKYWLAENGEPDDIEALVAGVVALGSFFSAQPLSCEAQLVEHAKQILDIGSAYAPARLSLDQAAAWVLRTLYLRLITRPHLSWYASCSAVHVVEAMGLHVDLKAVDLAVDESSALTADSIVSRRSIYECAAFLNAIISAEYGRSRIPLLGLTPAGDGDENAKSITPLMTLTRLLVLIETDPDPVKRWNALSSICALPDEPPIFVLLRTDVALHLYRTQVNARHEKLAGLERQAMISIIKMSLKAARHVLSSKQPWWNLISTPFQATMILMAMDSNETLDMIPECMSVLTDIYLTFSTPPVLEVIRTAKRLIECLKQRKLDQAEFLREAAEISGIVENPSTESQGSLTTDHDSLIFDGLLGADANFNFMFEGDCWKNSSLQSMSDFS
jgi:hypothetical protein